MFKLPAEINISHYIEIIDFFLFFIHIIQENLQLNIIIFSVGSYK